MEPKIDLMSTFYSIHSSWWYFFWVAIEMHCATWNQKSSIHIVIRLLTYAVDKWSMQFSYSFLLLKKKKNTTLCWKICIVDKSCLSPNIILSNQNYRSIKTSIWWSWHKSSNFYDLKITMKSQIKHKYELVFYKRSCLQ